MIYTVVHFFVIQNSKAWEARSGYEKFVTVTAIVVVALEFCAVAFG